jgi:FkbM family methyltransferase
MNPLQLFFDLAIRYPRAVGGIYRRLASAIFRRCEIRFSLCGVTLLAPADHLLPFFRRRYRGYSSNLGRLVASIASDIPGLPVIDIGANIGDSVAIIRAEHACPILCVEGEPRFIALMRRNLQGLSGIEIEPSLVGIDDADHASLVTGGGTASVGSTRGGASLPMIGFPELIRRHPAFDRQCLVKVDTDGFDLRILKSGIDFIRNRRPVLFIEFDPYFLNRLKEAPEQVIEMLAPLDYGPVLVYDNFGDFVTTVELTDAVRMADLIAYIDGRHGRLYVDLCIFPRELSALADSIGKRERIFCRQLRCQEQK